MAAVRDASAYIPNGWRLRIVTKSPRHDRVIEKQARMGEVPNGLGLVEKLYVMGADIELPHAPESITIQTIFDTSRHIKTSNELISGFLFRKNLCCVENCHSASAACHCLSLDFYHYETCSMQLNCAIV